MNKKTSPMDSDKVKKKIKNGELKIEGKARNEVEPRPIEEGVPESVIQAEGKAHQKEDKKIVIPEKTYEALEKKAKAEGKTTNQKVAEIIVEKAKAKPEKTEVFPTDARINDYGFLGFKTGWLADLGWTKGMALKIEKNADGSITLRKA